MIRIVVFPRLVLPRSNIHTTGSALRELNIVPALAYKLCAQINYSEKWVRSRKLAIALVVCFRHAETSIKSVLVSYVRSSY